VTPRNAQLLARVGVRSRQPGACRGAERGSVGGNDVIEGERGNHRCVPQCLKLGMPRVRRTFQLDDDQPSLVVDSEQVKAPTRVFPAAVFLRDDLQVGIDDFDLTKQQRLQVASFLQVQDSEVDRMAGLEPTGTEFVEGHPVMMGADRRRGNLRQRLAVRPTLIGPGRRQHIRLISPVNIPQRSLQAVTASVVNHATEPLRDQAFVQPLLHQVSSRPPGNPPAT
jgi:hypothetical protein